VVASAPEKKVARLVWSSAAGQGAIKVTLRPVAKQATPPNHPRSGWPGVIRVPVPGVGLTGVRLLRASPLAMR
jgi:hypothetical protein